ncbi:TetR/AcrR family transcriptional regulator [Amycolatopsis sp.]|uniref:TetR/AcrR family transcriptional regulator n=1 Tax=Amycolatopsis sp. TaxID=37632 RepID=UPI002E015429|nr:TetR/AcrR family transcriptional regulator [Amycolatopsis sp.]
MVRRTDTRQRILDTAAELFHTQGYHATGLNQLTSVGSAPKGSLYFHFPGGKEQLAAEAIAVSSAQLCEVLKKLVVQAPDAATGIESVVNALAQSLLDSDFQRGCPLATVALDVASESELIRQSCVDGYGSWHDALADYLIQQGLSAERAADLTTVVLASIEGGLLLAKTKRDIAPLRAIAVHLRGTIEREVG